MNRIELEYELNDSGGFKGLALGADKRRLGAQGDFNIELDFSSLIDGQNKVTIRAENELTEDTATDRCVFYLSCR